jgi:DNA-binding beta-propeller fold protein YncE
MKNRLSRNLIKFTAILLLSLTLRPSVMWAGEFSPSSLNSVSEVDLGLTAKLVELSSDGKLAYFALELNGKESADGAVASFNLNKMKIASEIGVPFNIVTLHAPPTQGVLFVAGSAQPNTILARIDFNFGTPLVRSTLTSSGPSAPSIATDDGLRLYVAGTSGNQIKIFPESAFLPYDMAEAAFKSNGSMEVGSIYYSGRGGVSGIGVTKSGSHLFVADNQTSLVSAVEAGGKNAITDDIGFGSRDVDRDIPLQMLVRTIAGQNEKTGDLSSLLLADYLRDRLVIADFSPTFSTLNVVSSGAINLPLLPGTVLEGESSPIFVGSDDNEHTILVGNRYSSKLLLFTRNGDALERIREFSLRAPPIALDVSDDGSTALVLHKGESIASLLTINAVDVNPNSVTDLKNSELVRELQRTFLNEFGFPVGAIDGLIGDKTRTAALAIERKYGVKLDLTDVEGTMKALKQLRATAD